MCRIEKTGLFLLFLLVSGCSPDMEGYRSLPVLSESRNFPYGGWIVAETIQRNKVEETVSGELIAHQENTFYILDDTKMNIIPDSLITHAKLYIYKKQPAIFGILTVIGFAPNLIGMFTYPEYAGQFLAMGIPAVVFGMAFTIGEVANTRNQLIYPDKDMLHRFHIYARFPQGIPQDVNPDELRLPAAN